MSSALYESNLSGLDKINQGKVRDIYAVDDDHLLIVTTDRLSAFDVILPEPIPGKGAVLTKVSNFWFNRTQDIVPNHLTDLDIASVITDPAEREAVAERAIVVKRLTPLPVEAVVRGYLIGSGWKDYQDTGAVCGIELPAGLEMASKLPEPIFTPATKAAVGDHDINIDFATMCDMIGTKLAEQVRDLSIKIYLHGSEYARSKGIIIADTKFEFGLDDNGKLFLIDEVMTPDSSRFWPADEYSTGISPPSFDKQFVRDHLETLDWNKQAPGPALPEDVIHRTAAKYQQALDIITS
ncbi:MAG: phosphoribosylaminoimidazolesuccinocarboxamide synthase [Gammaproteobacteria bacterium]